MTTKVHALFYSNSTLVGLFENEAGAKARIVQDALAGRTVSGAHIQEMPIIGTEPSRDAADYPAVVSFLIQGKKIQAIKEYRSALPGTSLYDAKQAVEAVNLLGLSPSVRAAAQALIPPPPPPRERYIFEHSAINYDVLEDDNGDYWVRIIGGKYVRTGWLAPSRDTQLPFKDDGAEVMDQTEIDEQYGIDDRWDF
jgi:ribosomal protein L7/L12